MPGQIVRSTLPVSGTLVDLSKEPDARAAAQAWIEHDRSTPIDIYQAPLFRTALIKLGDAHYYSYANYHHLIVDGIAAGLIQAQVAAAYQAFMRGAQPPTVAAYSYLSYVRRQSEERDTAQYHRAEDFWLSAYRDPPERISLSCRTPQAAAGPQFLHHDFTIPHEQSQGLEALSRRLGISYGKLLVGSVALLVSRLTGRHDLPFGLPTHGRTHLSCKLWWPYAPTFFPCACAYERD